MPGRGRRLDRSVPLERFALELRELHLRAGRPKQETLAHQMGCSHATVSAYLNGHRFPSWDATKKFVEACGGDVEDWRERWTGVASELRETELASTGLGLLAGVPDAESLRHAWYLNNEQFYLNAAERVESARDRILVTYLRRRPPEHYTSEAAARYFAAVLDWARRPGAHSVRRVLCAPNQEVRDWIVERHYPETREIRNYDARVVPWHMDADGLNMALFDDVTVFLAFSGAASQELSGFRVDSAEFLRYFVGYFDQLWAGGRPLEEYVRDQLST